jgi:small subunit ribosomal protein S21
MGASARDTVVARIRAQSLARRAKQAPDSRRRQSCDVRPPRGPDAAQHSKIGAHLQVLVRDNNVDQALRVLKKRMQREGIFREMKQRRAYEKPSEKKAREKAEAVRRSRKLARKQAQRDGLLPMPKKVLRTPARPPRPSFNSTPTAS